MKIVSRQPSEKAPARIGALSVLPVFLDLHGKRAIVAGGSDAAAWKAELLAAAGARIDLYAAQLSDGMAELLARETAIARHARDWDPSCFEEAAVAVADAQDDGEAATFEAAARIAGVPCNVIDRPAYCHFQFGSIVNRSPVVVGISTSGAAPILGQAVRRRIETLLPPSLAAWAELGRRLRDRVVGALEPGVQRRRFWEAFVDRAFGPAPDQEAEREVADSIARSASQVGKGRVTFVGAGPGEAELLTLKAVRALQSADVILFDDLVSDEVLELARREAKRILVGKRAGRLSCKQDEINEMMVRLADAGRRVVRLKSGDPMVFGRAGEEIAALEARGIAFDVVPGITAGLALAAALGVSLTHRDHAKSVRFVTGHSRHGGLPEDVDWRSVADRSATTIFYMGGRTAPEISARLLSLGLLSETPVVVASDLGRATQSVVHTTLGALPEVAARLCKDRAVLIGVGSVFRSGSDANRRSNREADFMQNAATPLARQRVKADTHRPASPASQFAQKPDLKQANGA
jgi:uroporphyrin-III C-methyltransferase / precorrin-2 dehydrogenase / sirohydrochlorin ferrochelatase